MSSLEEWSHIKAHNNYLTRERLYSSPASRKMLWMNRACDLGQLIYIRNFIVIWFLSTWCYDKSTASRSTKRFENLADEFEVPRYTLLAWTHEHNIYWPNDFNRHARRRRRRRKRDWRSSSSMLKGKVPIWLLLELPTKSFPQKPRSVKDLVDAFYIVPSVYFIASSNWIILYDRSIFCERSSCVIKSEDLVQSQKSIVFICSEKKKFEQLSEAYVPIKRPPNDCP